ncbi:MAG: hypothetical protein CBD16_05645 [Betaproteobacteria bacterium TMED156]|nr:MAG: hypothetical protein CBD16_05645 [Betaproteobacteria bacterium TMED156]
MFIFSDSRFNNGLLIPLMVLSLMQNTLTSTAVANPGDEEIKKEQESKTKTPAEEKLETIRQTLVSEALRAQARVKASAWLDESGALHENTRITSDVITTGSTATNKPNIPFVVNKIKPTTDKGSCNFFDPRYLRRAQIKVINGRSSLNLPNHELKNISYKISQLLKTGLQTNQNWLLNSPAAQTGSLYEKYLTSSSYEKADFAIELMVQTEEVFSHRLKRNHVVINLLYTIEDLRSKKIILSTNYPLPSPWAPPPLPVPRSGLAQIAYAIHEANMIGKFEVPTQKSYSTQFETAIINGVSTLINETNEAFLCKQITFTVREMRKNVIEINAGSKRGLKVGDQLLLIDSSLIPNHILEESALEKIALIEIDYVSANRAKASKVAGPNLGPVAKNSRSTITATPF